jgi:hypothetical protein
MKISIRHSVDQTLELEVEAAWSVGQFRTLIGDIIDVEPSQLRLVLAGRVIRDDDLCLTDYSTH